MPKTPVLEDRFLDSRDEAGTAPGDRRFRPDVEGLRAMAVLSVVLFHAGVPFVTGGYVGVDVFFVISGFVITGLLLRERTSTGKTSIIKFYARRVRRILPAATLVILATVVCSFLLLGAVSGNNVADDGRWAAVFLSNFHFETIGTNYFTASRPPSPLQNYWSLSVEEQFYVFYPTLFLIVVSAKVRLSLHARLSILLGLIIAASYWLSVVQTAASPAQSYFSPFTRAWELALGGLVAVCTHWLKNLNRPIAAALTWVGLAGIVYATFAFNSQTAYPGSLVAIPVVGAALIIAGGSAIPRVGAESVLGTQPLQWMGTRSYSLYLWHWPLLIIAVERAGKTHLPLGESLTLVLIAVAMSAVTYIIIENPIRHLPSHAKKSVVGGIAVIAVTLVLLSLAIGLNSAHASSDLTKAVTPAPSSQVVMAKVAAAPRISSVPKNVQPALSAAATDTSIITGIQSPACTAYTAESREPICVVGDTSGDGLLVVMGDSHASMWLPAFNSIAIRAHWKLVLLSKLYCPAELVTVVNPPGWGTTGGPFAACDHWHRWAVAWINKHKPSMLVVSQENGAFYDTSIQAGKPPAHFSGPQWQKGLTDLLRAITVPNIHKVVLGDIPVLSVSPPNCLGQHVNTVQQCSTPSSTAVSPFNSREAAAADASGATYIDTIPWFCSTVCTPIIGKFIAYWDPSHVTQTYARYLRLVLAQALNPVKHTTPG